MPSGLCPYAGTYTMELTSLLKKPLPSCLNLTCRTGKGSAASRQQHKLRLPGTANSFPFPPLSPLFNPSERERASTFTREIYLSSPPPSFPPRPPELQVPGCKRPFYLVPLPPGGPPAPLPGGATDAALTPPAAPGLRLPLGLAGAGLGFREAAAAAATTAGGGGVGVVGGGGPEAGEPG